MLPAEILKYSESKLAAIEPDYKTHLNIPSARRMSRLIKMGVSAALNCAGDAGLTNPDAIICGTGLGCMEDSEKFLTSLIDNNEQTLSPTAFIFSTHNTVAAQIALLMKCNNYNFTHTHRGLSFENALIDARLFLSDHPQSNVLVGAADEVTATSYKILERLGAIRKKVENDEISAGIAEGVAAGEGASFFTLNGMQNESNLAKFSAVETFSNLGNDAETAERLNAFIRQYQVSDDDFILLGMNGDARGDAVYHHAVSSHFKRNVIGSYKHLCGEFHTSSAFAFWLGARVLKEKRIPRYLLSGNDISAEAKRIFIFNHYKGREFSFILLERC